MKLKDHIKKMLIKPGSKVSLKDHPAAWKTDFNKEKVQQLMEKNIDSFKEMQDEIYINNQYSVLIVIQAMDAAGKDSLVKHVIGSLNPAGIKVVPFKAPTDAELDHDYLWRHNLALPGRGEIGIFVRSHYENVLITRVHPEYVVGERIPGIDHVDKVNKQFFKTRFRQINDWERHLTENGTRIIKIFLHSSKEEQKRQFLERIDDESKNWKFNIADIKERAYWDDYMAAYEDLLSNTSTDWAPWYVLPADERWFARLAAGGIIYREFAKLKLDYPVVGEEDREILQKARQQLMSE